MMSVPAFYVYILECIDKKGKVSYYTGSTKNLHKRIDEHIKGKGARYTKGKKVNLVFYESYLSNSDARKREIEIKSLTTENKKKLFSNQ